MTTDLFASHYASSHNSFHCKIPLASSTITTISTMTKVSQSKRSPSKKAAASASPNRKSKSELKVVNNTSSPSKMTKPPNQVWGENHRGSIIMYGFESGSNPGNEAFCHPAIQKARSGAWVESHGIIGVGTQRDPNTNGALQNASNTFFRHIFYQYDPDATEESIHNTMEHLATFMTDNNRFNHEYIVGENRTPSDPAQWKRVDESLLNNDVVSVIHATFNNVTTSWFDNNQDDYDNFFTPPYCGVARAVLGYPEEGAGEDNGGDGTNDA
jgi:hypothetical protein